MLWQTDPASPDRFAPGTPAGPSPLFPGAPVAPPAPRRGWRWWTPRVLAGLAALFLLLVVWLALTAPLSKSLAPLAPPQITLLAADGTPIARNGANVEAPVAAAKLPRHVIEAFLAVEDRNFYSHWGVDPRGLARAPGAT